MWDLRKLRNGPLKCTQDTNWPNILWTLYLLLPREICSKQNKKLPRNIVSHRQADHTWKYS